MRRFLYDAIGRSCIMFAGASDRVGNLLVLLVVKSFTFFKVSYAHLCMWLLTRVDNKRVAAEKAETAQQQESLELGLMQAAVRIKENAVEIDDWTDEHSHALNMIGVQLIEECGWEAPAVHKYFRPLVESIEGLDYGTDV